MYVPAAVCSHASWAGRGGKGREGRKGSRKEEHHRFTNSRKVTKPLSMPFESDVFVHSRHYVTWSYISATNMTKPNACSFVIEWQLCHDGFHAAEGTEFLLTTVRFN